MTRKLSPWCFVATLALLLVAGRAAADPLTDSFVGSTKHPVHKTTTKKPAGKPAPKARPRPGHSNGASSNANEFADDKGASGNDDSPPPPRRTRKPAATESSDYDRGGEAEDQPAARRSPAASRRPVPKKKKPTRSGDEDEEDDAGNDEGGQGEEDDGDAPSASLPVVSARMLSFQLGGTITGRNFKFDVPLQHESSFPRFGFLAGLETYPLRLLDEGWYRTFGLAASYSSEVIGQASVAQSDGSSSNTPVKQARWAVELRYALELGNRVVLTPALGLDGTSFTLSTKAPIMASACTATQTVACLPDTQSLLFGMGSHLRIAATAELGISLDATYLQALLVKNRPVNEIGYEAGTSANGFNIAGGATYLLTDWLAVHGEIPITRLTFTFHNPPTPYRSATELYYGLTAALVVMTK